MKIGVAGAGGRMGRMVLATIMATPDCEVAGGNEHPAHACIGADLGVLGGGAPLGMTVTDDVKVVFSQSDVVIDFTTPAVIAEHARLATQHHVGLIIGTTGLEANHMASLKEAAAVIPVVQAANMSVGVNLLLGLTRHVASVLGEDFDIEIVEMHHRHKVDAPSGTALALGRVAAEGRGKTLDELAVRGRDGITGPRVAGTIGLAALRGGDVVGDHTVMFASEGERIELVHKASSRAIFARGAVRAALWSQGREPGLYGMVDVLGLS